MAVFQQLIGDDLDPNRSTQRRCSNLPLPAKPVWLPGSSRIRFEIQVAGQENDKLVATQLP